MFVHIRHILKMMKQIIESWK